MRGEIYCYLPFSHSLLAALVWSVIAFVAYKNLPIFRGTQRAALLVGACVLVHWFLDLLEHRVLLRLCLDRFLVGEEAAITRMLQRHCAVTD